MTAEVMSDPATADCIRVLCLGAWAEKWRMAEWERVFMTAEDMVGVCMLEVAGNVRLRLGGLIFEILRYVKYLGGGIEAILSLMNGLNMQMCRCAIRCLLGPEGLSEDLAESFLQLSGWSACEKVEEYSPFQLVIRLL